ncbi:hypothetical protein [Microbacterium azadirachtae]|uniref:hypothetical protein n=1 Tax=Microbacterium azadirachtae TaxID=582680 RepID=UPI000890572B|nr:hypothetical protein [Microbacterium azadirachtae]SDM52012.1 hypothetical protein SAMN04488593_0002 [Microbacterium azadirachtae]SEG60544.1 hypothetical protein SAMN04488594_3738 [Microbacterium azadirachtae]SEG63592.1 hypothetical protein SAMN04488592_0006 [Microbacterium azadirachtae]
MSIAPWFDAAAEFERALLERNAPLAELHRQAQLDGAARLRAAGSLRAPSPWQGTTSVSGMRQAIVEAEVYALLREYAAQAAAATDGADSARWTALVDEGLTRSRRGLLVDEVRDSAAGALVLRDSWGLRPVVPNAPVIDCACGYAESGVIAKGLCIECGELVVRRWSAEELRLLALVPEYRARVEEILSTEARQKKQIGVPSDTPISDVASKRARGGRALGRLRRSGRRLLVAGRDLPSERWKQLAALTAKALQIQVGAEGRRAGRRGLGAAGLAALAVKSDDAIHG